VRLYKMNPKYVGISEYAVETHGVRLRGMYDFNVIRETHAVRLYKMNAKYVGIKESWGQVPGSSVDPGTCPRDSL